jgi:hypothetical protein
MDEKLLIEALQVFKSFCAAHATPLPEEASIWQLNSAKERISALSSREITDAFYEAMVEVRRLHVSHKTQRVELGQDHEDALAAHKQKIAGNARATFHRFVPVLRRFLRGEIPLEQARTDVLDAIDPSLRDGEMMNDLTGVLEEANAFRAAHEERGKHVAIAAAYVNAELTLYKMVS